METKTLKKVNGEVFPSLASAMSAFKRLGLDLGPEEYKVVRVGEGFVVEYTEKTQALQDDPFTEETEVETPLATEVAKGNPAPTVELVKAWRPASILEVPAEMQNPKFTYRWVNTSTEGNVLKKQEEGWEIDREMSAKRAGEFKHKTQSLDTTTRLRELILMRMPKTVAAQRNKYYRDLSKANFTQAEDDDTALLSAASQR